MVRAHTAAFFGILIAASIVSCGGSTFTDDDDDGGAGSSSGGSGNASRGGATGSGNSGNSGATGGSGAVGGGSGAVGGGQGMAGSGSGGAPPDVCSLPAEGGNCDSYIPMFFHNSATGVCEPFVYGGCGGNENQFATAEECQAVCNNIAPNLDSCTSPLECELVSVWCCEPCDGTLQDFTAINVAAREAFFADRICPDVECEACPPSDPTLTSRQYLTATCRAGECVPVDVRHQGLGDCETSADCYLRAGLGCCEDCGAASTELVALSNGAGLGELVCGGDVPPCLACEPAYPDNMAAICDAGFCALTYTF